MKFANKIIIGRILNRYQRFLADIELLNGEIITAHCPNSGSMTSCWDKNWKVLLTLSNNPKRKYPYTLELIHNGFTWIGVNTMRSNTICREAIENNLLRLTEKPYSIKMEAVYSKTTRFDILLETETEKIFVEVKNTTLKGLNDYVHFPDSVSLRGQKHLLMLMDAKKHAYRAVLIFLVQREDVSIFSPAKMIDPIYAKLLKQAVQSGVEIFALQCFLDEEGVEAKNFLQIEI